jgi:hypothetical protein
MKEFFGRFKTFYTLLAGWLANSTLREVLDVVDQITNLIVQLLGHLT